VGDSTVFTWTEGKNRINKQKHGFYLSDIVDVFDDPHLLELYDDVHSTFDEDRYITIGRYHNVILFVVTMDKADDDTQIISARKATPKEEGAYYEHYRKSADSGRD
jgi:uncharacterized DUF497 family protein